jgi:NAD(P)-dependent dehydrogenase (short-subunit alcohol dehydrogenase family)
MRTPSKWDQEDKSNITVAAMDVTSEESIAAVVKEIIDKDGKIDILVNNAGYIHIYIYIYIYIYI